MTAPTLVVIEYPMQDSHGKLCSNLEKPLKFTVRGANSPPFSLFSSITEGAGLYPIQTCSFTGRNTGPPDDAAPGMLGNTFKAIQHLMSIIKTLYS